MTCFYYEPVLESEAIVKFGTNLKQGQVEDNCAFLSILCYNCIASLYPGLSANL